MTLLVRYILLFIGFAFCATTQAQTNYVSITPARFLDTRAGATTVDGQSAGGGAIVGGTSINLTVLGRDGIPSTGVSAVALNITVTNAGSAGFLTVWPAGASRPLASNLNFVASTSISNLVIAKVGTGGQISIFVNGGAISADVIADVAGYFPSTTDIAPLTPARLLDTRSGATTVDGLFAGGGAVGTGTALNLTVLGRGGVPASGVSAVIINVTAVNPTASGYVTAWSTGISRPATSNINYVSGQTVPNLVMVSPGTGGAISLFVSAGVPPGSADLTADVVGYFPSTTAFDPLVPARLLDTRAGGTTIDGQFAGQGALGPQATLNLTVLGRGGVPASGVGAVALNLTVASPTATGYVESWQSGVSRPLSADLNFTPSVFLSTLTLVPVGTNGQVSLFNSAGSTPLIADVVGWFPSTPPAAPASVTATATSGGVLKANWTLSNSGNAPTYLMIQRKLGAAGSWMSVNNNYTPATSGQLTELVNTNGDYYYEVAACNNIGCSAYTASTTPATVVSFPATPTSQSPTVPTIPSTDPTSDGVGATVAQFRVDEGGNATYSIPIQVPPGTAGVAPKMALSYNSRLPVGVMGPGWTIEGASQITRCRQTRENGDFAATSTPDGNAPAVNFTATDRFCLDGVRLLLLTGNTGAYGAQGTTYSPETDPTTKVTLTTVTSAQPMLFTVQRKDGTTSTYGGTPTGSNNALVTNTGGAISVSWNVARVQDSTGNYMDFQYAKSASSAFVESTLTAVNYTGHATSPTSIPYASVAFSYTTLPLANYRFGSQAGVMFSQSQQLSSVTVSDTTNGTLRYYSLAYSASLTTDSTNPGSGSGLQRLVSVTECRSNGGVCFAPTTFAWSQANYTFQIDTLQNTGSGNPTFQNLAGYKIADVDGDGRADFVFALNDGVCGTNISSIYVGFTDTTATNQMTIKTLGQVKTCAPINLSGNDQSWFLVDYDGDGRADLMLGGQASQSVNSGAGVNWKLYASLGRPASGSAVFSTTDLLSGQNITSAPCGLDTYLNQTICPAAVGTLADINGDGLPDFIYPTDVFGDYSVRFLTRQTISGVTSLTFSAPYSLIYTVTDGTCSSFGNSPTCAISLFNSNSTLHRSAIAADVNGDGRADFTALVQVTIERECDTCAIQSPSRHLYWAQFTTTTITPPSGSTGGTVTLTEGWYDSALVVPTDATELFVADLNGDGLADLLYEDVTTATTFHALINQGNGTYSTAIEVDNISNGSHLQLADINGDGRPEIIYPVGGACSGTCPTWTFSYVSLVPSTTSPYWTFSTATALPSTAVHSDGSWISLFGDFDGDGATDFLAVQTVATSQNLYTSRAAGSSMSCNAGINNASCSRYHPRDVIAQIANGQGATTTLAYQPLTNVGIYQRGHSGAYPALTTSIDYGWGSPVFDVLAPMYVVTQASSSAPTQISPTGTSQVFYRYGGATMQAGGRGFLGFYENWSYDNNDPAAVNPQYVATVNRYAQRYPITGMPIATLKQVFNGSLTRGASLLDNCAANTEYVSSGQSCFSGLTGSGSTLAFQVIWPDQVSSNSAASGIYISNSGQIPLCAGPGCQISMATASCTVGGTTAPPSTGNAFIGPSTPGPVMSYVGWTADTLYDLASGAPTAPASIASTTNYFCYDGNGSTAGYGELTNSRTLSQTPSGTTVADKSTTNAYGSDSSSLWYWGRLTQSVVTFARPGQSNTTRQSNFTYDTTTGLLTSEEIQSGAGPSQDLRTIYTLDAYGNRVAAYQCSSELTLAQCGSTSSFVYEQSGTQVHRYAKTLYGSGGRYSTDSELPFYTTSGFTEQKAAGVITRDEFGNPTQQYSINDSTSTATQFSKFGVMGRPYFTGDDSGRASTTTYRNCGTGGSQVGCSTDTHFKFRSQTVTAGAPTTWAYYDLLGRPVLKVTQNFDSNATANQFSGACTFYDSHNRVVYQSEPFFISAATGGGPNITTTSGSPCSSATYSTTTSYDVLGRVLTVVLPDNTVSITSQIHKIHKSLATTTTNPRGYSWQTVTNVLGEVIQTNDPGSTFVGGGTGGGDTASNLVVYQCYDAAGNVLSIRRSANDSDCTHAPTSAALTTTFVYDALGRKTSQTDVDSGTTSFTYNAAGDVITSTDAKVPAQTVTHYYDAMGRQYERVATGTSETITDIWTYDTALHGYGQVFNESHSNSAGTSYSRSMTYDTLGRLYQRSTSVAASSYTETTAYDSVGRPYKQQDASGEIVTTNFSTNGYVSTLSDTRIGGVGGTLYSVLGMNERGKVTSERRGGTTNLQTTLGYDAPTGRLASICSGLNGTTCSLQDIAYRFDVAGNLIARTRGVSSTSKTAESLTYDSLNRLTISQVQQYSGSTPGPTYTLSTTYDSLGNLCTKTDTQLSGQNLTYVYAGPAGCTNHGATGSADAVASIQGGATYQYDADGNQISRSDGRTFTYNALNQVESATLNAIVTKFEYGPDGERYLRNDNGVITFTIGKVEIEKSAGSVVEMRRYLGVAIDLVVSNDTRYTFSDHLGSIDAIAHSDGTKVTGETESFDAWGNRRNPDTWQGSAAPPTTTTRGFTGHEHADNLGFIHMNGRIYDPQLGKMLQADPVQNPGSQGLNRYSYVANNPLSLIDPTGYSWFSNILEAVAGIAIAVWAPELFETYLHFTEFWATVAAGATAGLVTSGGSLQGALVGAFSAGLFYGIGQGFDNLSGNSWATDGGTIGSHNLNWIGFSAKVVAHGIAGGVMSKLEGGKFGNGFLSAGVGEAAGPEIDKLDEENNPLGQSISAERVTVAAIVGGTTSAITGGSFTNGAVTAAFGRAFNEEHLIQRQKGVVLLTGHSVDGGPEHTAIEFTDGTGSHWISAGPPIGLGAFSSDATLIGGQDSQRPTDTPANNYSIGIIDPPTGMSPAEYFASLQTAQANYCNCLPYNWFPTSYGIDSPGAWPITGNPAAYNSNGFTAGIIHATGGTPPSSLQYDVGGNKPVPDAYFQKH